MITIRNLLSLFAIVCLTCYVCASPSNAATINAASCSRDHVSTAISAASSGDTVLVPAGPCTWSSQLDISKAITLQGTGAGKTVITSNVPTSNSYYLISYSAPTSTSLFRITGFTFNLNSQSQGIYFGNSSTTYRAIRMDNNSFTNCKNSAYPTVVINGTFKGVIDNNTFTGYPHFDNYGTGGGGKDSWNNLTYTHGSEDNVYWEDNDFTISNSSVSAFTSGGHGGRYVYRYNTYSSNIGIQPVFDFHGNQTAGVFGTMGVAIYGNKITMTNNGAVKISSQRGGKALIFNNKAITSQTVSLDLYEQYEDAYDSKTQTNYTCPNDAYHLYPGKYGCASDKQPDHASDSYYWNNRQSTTLRNPFQTSGFLGTLVENVHWWSQKTPFNGTSGVGCGTLVSRPASCTVGVGYWATNQSCSTVDDANIGRNPQTPISGTLYKCTATNIWTAYYTPYTYPHPLRRWGVTYIIETYDHATGWVLEAGKTYTYSMTVKTAFIGKEVAKALQESTLYSAVTSIASVESKAGSYYYDATAGKLYVRSTNNVNPNNYLITVYFQN
jgi:hypothetical protein